MTNFEYITAASAAVTSFFTLVIAIYGALQIKFLKENQRNEYSWDKKKAAQDAVWKLHALTDCTLLLNSFFDITNRSEPIPLDELDAAFRENKDLQLNVQKLLNSYDALARGVNLGIYDKEVIKIARGQCLIRHFKNYMLFILKRRVENKKRNKGDEIVIAYNEMQKLAFEFEPKLKDIYISEISSI